MGKWKHGNARRQRKTRAYLLWEAMHRRCYMPSQDSYSEYGGRGIKVCDAWRDFREFHADMGDPPAGHSLERRDNDLDYGPENCLWVPLEQQQRNRRINHMIEWRGETKCIAEWARSIGMKAKTLRARLVDHGMTVEQAMTLPLGCARRTGHKTGHISISTDKLN